MYLSHFPLIKRVNTKKVVPSFDRNSNLVEIIECKYNKNIGNNLYTT